MDSRPPQSAPSPDQIRQRREEAARRQEVQLKQQALKIEQQRQLAARQKNGAAAIPTARPGLATGPVKVPAAVPPVRPAAPEKKSAWSKVAEVVTDSAPPPARAPVPAAMAAPQVPRPAATNPPNQSNPRPQPVVLRAKAAPVTLPPPVDETLMPPPHPDSMAAVPEISDADMRAEMAEFAPVSVRTEPPPLPPPLPPLESSPEEVEIVSPFDADVPELKLVMPPKLPTTPSAVEAPMPPPLPVAIELPKPSTTPVDEENLDVDFPDLKMMDSPDLYCPKCQVLIPESHRGSYYTACPKCGEIVKMK